MPNKSKPKNPPVAKKSKASAPIAYKAATQPKGKTSKPRNGMC